jgi:hypothetical protein
LNHQPEAQHPKSSAFHKLPADYPIFTPQNCRVDLSVSRQLRATFCRAHPQQKQRGPPRRTVTDWPIGA